MIQKVKTPYGTARVYKRDSKNAREYIMVVPGYSESLSHNRELVDLLHDKGYSAFTFSQPRRQAGAERSVIHRNKSVLLTIIGASISDDSNVYAVAHSFGSVPLLKAAQETPSRFKELILMQPSGLTVQQDFATLANRTVEKIARNTVNTLHSRHFHKLKKASPGNKPRSITTRRLVRTQLSSGYMIAKNPRLALKEAFAAIRHDIGSDIAVVKAAGVPVHIVVAHDDELFKLRHDGVNYSKIIDSPGAYHSLADEHASHDTFWMHPERTAEAIITLVNQNLKNSE